MGALSNAPTPAFEAATIGGLFLSAVPALGGGATPIASGQNRVQGFFQGFLLRVPIKPPPDRLVAVLFCADEQLDAILSEPSTWTVNGRNGQVLCTVHSLRQALDRAASLVDFGAVVTAICRMPDANIIVFEAQAVRLRKLCAAREVTLFTEMDQARYRSPASITCAVDFDRLAGPAVTFPQKSREPVGSRTRSPGLAHEIGGENCRDCELSHRGRWETGK